MCRTYCSYTASKSCQKILDDAEKKVTVLLASDDGEIPEKPFDIDEVKEAIETALSNTYVPKMIDVYCKRVKYPLIEEEIRYVKAFDGYSEIYAGNNVYRKKCSLDELETLLSDCLFVRLNREILVNLRWVEHIDTGTIQIQEKEFRVSRRRKKVVEHKFIEFDLKYRKEFS